MKNVLITGITGQDGIFLTSEIIKKYTNTNIIGISRSKDNNLFYKRLKSLNTNIEKNLKIIQINLEDKNQVLNFIKDSNPEYIFNLSGPSSVYESYKDQSKTEESVKLIFNNLTDSLIETNNLANFFQASSSEMFGISNNMPLHEESHFIPRSPYAKAKLRNHEKVISLRDKYSWPIYSGIMFNHESQFRSKNYLFMKVIDAAKKIKEGKLKELTVGSLDYVRDWSYARDTVQAILLIIQKGVSGSYVIGSGDGHKISDLIEKVFNSFDLNYLEYVKVDNNFLREGDPEIIISNPHKIKKELNWNTETSFEQLIDYCIHSQIN